MKNEMTLNADATRLLLAINGELDAAALEALILSLGSIRKAMHPAVPRSEQDNGGAQLRCTSETLSSLGAEKPDQQGNCLLRVRSERFGWLGWWLAQDDARQLKDFLATYYPAGSPPSTSGGSQPKH